MATPLASLLGVKETVRLKVPHNSTLESYYCNITKSPTQVHVCTYPYTLKKDRVACCVCCQEIKYLNLTFVLFSDFNSKSLQADWLFRKTSAAMVQETKEPGQTEFAQKVSRGQVNSRTHVYAHMSIELWSSCLPLRSSGYMSTFLRAIVALYF